MREAQIWYSRSPEQPPISAEFENVVVLSDDFYQEIQAHPVPNDLEAVKVLAASPAILDLYIWLSYRSFKAKGTESIPIFGEFGLANQRAASNTAGRGGSAPCSNNGSTQYARSGPNARRESSRTARISRSETRRLSVNTFSLQQRLR